MTKQFWQVSTIMSIATLTNNIGLIKKVIPLKRNVDYDKPFVKKNPNKLSLESM